VLLLFAMPADPKVKISKQRRDAEDYKFDGAHAREIEAKRKKGLISCAE
jgi:hypothetical protein